MKKNAAVSVSAEPRPLRSASAPMTAGGCDLSARRGRAFLLITTTVPLEVAPPVPVSSVPVAAD